MVDVSPEQYLMLRQIKKAKMFPSSNLIENEKEIIDFLIHEGFVTSIEHSEYVDSHISRTVGWIDTIVDGYEITQAGSAQIHAFNQTHLGRWLPIAISTIALIISIIALAK